MSLEFDFDTLEEDLDTVLALESLGAPISNPAIQTIRKRWCIDTHVAHESGAQEKTSGTLYQMYNEMSGFFASRAKKAVDLLTGQANRLEEHLNDAEGWLRRTTTFDATRIKTGSWTAKVCFEDKPDLTACLKLADSANSLEAVVKQYTIVVNQMALNPSDLRRKLEDGELKKIGYSSNSAIHRASGIIGRFTGDDVQARPLAGNVIIVTHGSAEKPVVEFGVGHGGEYGDEMKALTKAECVKALTAARKIVKTLRDRSAKDGVFGYTGIYKEVEKMRDNLKELKGEELRIATRRYKNAIQLENGVTTAMGRVGEGLVEWVARTLKANS